MIYFHEMAYTAGRRFIQPIRASLASITSPYPPISYSTSLFCSNLKTWIKGLDPVLHSCASDFRCHLYIRRPFTTNFSFSGSGLIMGSVIGVSSLYGFTNLSPCFAHAMNGHDILLDDYHVNSWDNPDLEEEPRALTFVRKLWLPIIFFVTVLMNWDHPFILVVKLSLFLLSTRPAPFSVYLFVEQLRHQYILKSPLLYKFKSLYANKVEIKDYKLLCFARVELSDQKFSLIGILGGWWTLPSPPSQGTFSVLKNRALTAFSEIKERFVSIYSSWFDDHSRKALLYRMIEMNK